MEWTLVNASQWDCIENEVSIVYFKHKPYTASYGPFAWLTYHKKTQRLEGARDHFGQAPFYYTYHDTQLIFGSSIPDLFHYLPEVPPFSAHLIRDCFLRYPADDPIDDPMYRTESYYRTIYRVTPGHRIIFKKKSVEETAFWDLDPEKPKLYYRDPRDYAKHFEWLLHQALQKTIYTTHRLALELSGGLDSTMILMACRALNLKPFLITHIPPNNRQPTAEDLNIQTILNTLKDNNNHIAVDASTFDPLPTFKKFARILGGPPPNLNTVLSNNIHEALKVRGYRDVLSGYGGDDCVSLNVPSPMCINPETLYQYEKELLQGQFCHEIRMRLEYAAVLTNALGLRYHYPLLYPPLIEFCFSLPFEQKYQHGQMRLIAKHYLTQQIPKMRFSTKTGAVVPSTMQKCRAYYQEGKFNHAFSALPFESYIASRTTTDDKMILKIHAYMVKEALIQHHRRRTIKSCALRINTIC